jgi:hypothetical protein
VKPPKRWRPSLPPVSDQMKAWSAALTEEIKEWPQVATRTFFGFTALYRKDRIFALLPRTRAMGTPNSLAFKFDPPTPQLRGRLDKDGRIGTTQMRAARWSTFKLATNGDLRDALDWLGQAYQEAGKKKRTR